MTSGFQPQKGDLDMKHTSILLAGIIGIAFLCMVGITAAETGVPGILETPVTAPEDIPAYAGPFGANSPLYGLKLAWEDLDESFTTNASDRVDKQMNHARLRLSEVRRELAENRTDTAQQAIDLYWQKVNMTQMSLAYFGSNQTGLVHAQEMHLKHQAVLEELMLSHPNNTGLARAYNNSLRLEARFEEKTQLRFEKIMEKNNRTIFRTYNLDIRAENRTGNETRGWNKAENGAGNKSGNTGSDRGNRTAIEEKRYGGDDINVTPGQSNGNGHQAGGNGQQNTKNKGQGIAAPTITTSPQDAASSGQDTKNSGNGKSNGNGNPKK
jgi:hypothetical protein